MQMNCEIRQVDSNELREKVFALRKEVFVVEQKVAASEEFDKFEDQATHFVVLDENKEPIGSARWRKTEKGIKLERFAVKKRHRGKGLGTEIVAFVLKDIESLHHKGTYLFLHAQIAAVSLYQKFGFKVKGLPFDECGISHHLMYKRI